MKNIALTKGYTTQVDDKEYERCMAGRKWQVIVHRREDGTIRAVYAIRTISKPDGTKASEYMHCLIMGTTMVDHKDGNGLNNQRHNLRKATNEQNGDNRKLNKNSTSGYKGVSWYKATRKYVAYVYVRGKRITLGYFVNVLDAKAAADAGRLKYHKEFALTNAMLEERVAA